MQAGKVLFNNKAVVMVLFDLDLIALSDVELALQQQLDKLIMSIVARVQQCGEAVDDLAVRLAAINGTLVLVVLLDNELLQSTNHAVEEIAHLLRLHSRLQILQVFFFEFRFLHTHKQLIPERVHVSRVLHQV